MNSPAAPPTEPFATSTWRLIIDDEPRTGMANMAIDQAVAEACAAGESLPTLRFYRWEPPAVSVGRHQFISDIDLEAVEARGYDIVRRTTGGRAILHTDELTYSVAGPDGEPRLSGGVMDAYLRLSNALVLGLQRLGLRDVEKAGGHVRAGPDVSAACFEVPSAYEIVVGGRKLMGSAQSRRARHVLQHGSLPLTGDITRLVDVLVLEGATRGQLRNELAAHACTLASALGVDAAAPEIGFRRVADIMAGAFADELTLALKPATLSPAELRRSAQLLREQFANPSWTNYR